MNGNDKMELNRDARKWLHDNKPELFRKDGVIILAARPHEFKLKRGGYEHLYLRWTWNVHVHGELRKQPFDFVLIQYADDMKVIDVFDVPFSEASKRKSISVYHSLGLAPRKRFATNWIEQYRV